MITYTSRVCKKLTAALIRFSDFEKFSTLKKTELAFQNKVEF